MVRLLSLALPLLAHLLIHNSVLVLQSRGIPLIPAIVNHLRLRLQMATGPLADHIRLLRLGALITSCLPSSHLLTEVKRVGLRVARRLHVALLQRAARLALRNVDRVLLASRRLHCFYRLRRHHAAVRHLILKLDLLLKLLLSIAAHLGALHVLAAYASIVISNRLLHSSLGQTTCRAEQLLSGR